ncbi:hypothetical protein Ddc_24540 [Ditylenchus destructor]|nr:hypothetical protein Ddc_24540 [Ditylenchus destructor]
MAHFEALIELIILAKFQPPFGIAQQVVSHRNLENPGFSHGHNWLCATGIRASNGSFCSSHRADHTGKVSDPTKYCGASYESLQSRE